MDGRLGHPALNAGLVKGCEKCEKCEGVKSVNRGFGGQEYVPSKQRKNVAISQGSQ